MYQLTHSGSGWAYGTLYDLPGSGNSGPYRKLVMDSAGNLYGTTVGNGGPDFGTVFKLTHYESG